MIEPEVIVNDAALQLSNECGLTYDEARDYVRIATGIEIEDGFPHVEIRDADVRSVSARHIVSNIGNVTRLDIAFGVTTLASLVFVGTAPQAFVNGVLALLSVARLITQSMSVELSEQDAALVIALHEISPPPPDETALADAWKVQLEATVPYVVDAGIGRMRQRLETLMNIGVVESAANGTWQIAEEVREAQSANL